MALNPANKLAVPSLGYANDATNGSAPGTPNIGTIRTISSAALKLALDFTAGAESLKIQRSTDNISFSDIPGAELWTENTYEDTGLSAGTTYYYRYSATNEFGTSSYSNSFNESTTATNQILRNIWTEFKSQLENNSTLDTYVSSRFLFSREPDIEFDKQIPHVKAWVADSDPEFDTFPKRQEEPLVITGHVKVKANTAALLEDEMLKANELISNAVGSDLTINGTGRIANMVFSYRNLDKSDGRTGQCNFTVTILSIRFKAGFK